MSTPRTTNSGNDRGEPDGGLGKRVLSGGAPAGLAISMRDADEGSVAREKTGAAQQDERLRKSSWISTLLKRPEFAAISGTVLVFAIFAFTAGDSGMFRADGVINWLQVSAYLGIIAVGACLLMIAGEFDLSIGSMIGFAGMVVALPAVYFHWPLWVSILLAFAGSIALGALNGYLVIRTKLPSFIVTLAFLFILRGLTLALSIMFANRTVVSGVGDLVANDWLARTFFYGTVGNSFFSWLAQIGWMPALPNGDALINGIPKVIVWWVAMATGASLILARTQFGNWIFAVGGDANAARNVGVPVKKVKISLFVFTAFCACVFAVLQVCDIGSAAADRGLQKEFEAIIAAVIGGCLLTGGYGSVVGACFGAVIFGVVQIGITYTNISSDWFRVFLGAMLLLAVLFNNFVRIRVAQAR
jgi:simple sugar transport system permease protein